MRGIVWCLVLVGWCWCGQLAVAQQPLRIKGSDTMYRLVKLQAEQYAARQQGWRAVVAGGGSKAGISALLNGEADMALSSRPMKPEERQAIEAKGHKLGQAVIGYDALSVIVHSGNTVSQLSSAALSAIFTGQISNWKQVGGPNLPIVVYTREASSGSHEFVREVLMDRKEFSPSAKPVPNIAAMVEAVSQQKGAIGYVGLAYLEEIVKPVAVSVGRGRFVMPNFRNVINRHYPVSRPLYVYYLEQSSSQLQGFVNFMLSHEGQKAVMQKGFVPLPSIRAN